MRMSWDSEEQHDAKEQTKGAAAERAKIRKAQSHAIRVLRELAREEVECAADYDLPGCTSRRHAADCPRGIALEAIRGLNAATKEPR